MAVGLAVGTPTDALAATPAPACTSVYRLQDLEAILAATPMRIVGFEHMAARRSLQEAQAHMLCLQEVIHPARLAWLNFLLTLAEFYELDEKGALDGPARDRLVSSLHLARTQHPGLTWDTSTFGNYGLELWEEAGLSLAGAPRVSVNLPANRPDALWIDGVPVPVGQKTVKLLYGTHLIQRRPRGKLLTEWWTLTPDEGEPLFPGDRSHEHTGGEPVTTTARPEPTPPPAVPSPSDALYFKAEVAAERMPLTFSGVGLELQLPVGKHLEVGLGLRGGLGPGATLNHLLPSFHVAARGRLTADGRLRVGLAGQVHLGGGFAAAETAPDEVGSLAYGALLEGLYALPLGSWRLEARLAPGVVVWPGVITTVQGVAGLGLSRRLGGDHD